MTYYQFIRLIGYIYVLRWKVCFHQCLMMILALSIYVWRGWLIVASMLDALAHADAPCACAWGLIVNTCCLLSSLLLCCRCHRASQCVAKRSLCACAWRACWWHMLLLQPSCYHCCHCASQYDSIMHLCTRPCCLLTLYAMQYEMHKALSLSTLWDVTLKMACTCAQGLVDIAVMRRNGKMNWLIWNWSFMLAHNG